MSADPHDPVVPQQGASPVCRNGDARRLSVPNAKRVRLILLARDSAKASEAMNQPGLRFHGLKGLQSGRFAVDASGNYRITFGWDGADAIDVDLEDYH
ncbi:type II toxin-antitoxin system RelE/ParE family toxin [Methylobacterium sp. 2A]|jgi:toxin HigB-1|uniref:type II toxin-antitoxin system RelE/ParE family toxin n=1 Tax=Methylobacterium sp. 2A TaxID=2603816 RepID=UPI001FEE1229|nr:type II toxin-antitoxin system RelE/ParE family toxin [Methylobacterium sp. 2A]